jgi:hypothetical protein
MRTGLDRAYEVRMEARRISFGREIFEFLPQNAVLGDEDWRSRSALPRLAGMSFTALGAANK